MALEAGSLAGPYEVQRVLGAGAMGTVYLARDRRLGREVALKVLHLDDDDRELRRRRLLHEARAVSSLNHPNICQIFDVGDAGADAWIAMEYVPGESLQAAIPPGGLPSATVLRIGVQLADALAHAHAQGLIHRDLKTANIMCSRDGRPKILDFGLAIGVPDRVELDLTRTTASVATPPAFAGTVAYMAPEILRSQMADERSDLWSLGVILYEMASGTRPFAGTTVFEVAASILEQAPEPLPAGVTPALSRAIGRLLRKDPHERYAHASELKAALESMGADETAIPAPAAAARTATGRRLVIAGAVLLALGALVWVRWPRARHWAIAQEHPFSTFGGSQRAPSLSPDGSMLAFSAPDGNGVEQIWVQSRAQNEPLKITAAAADATRPRWSPANDRIVFAIRGSGIWSVAPLGGNLRRIVEKGSNPNLSRDGARVVYERDRVIWTADADGSNARAVPGVQPHFYDVPDGPAFSPDGGSIAYFLSQSGPLGDLWVIPTAGGTPRQLTSDLSEAGWPVWTDGGRTIVFSSARAGSRTLWQIPASGGPATALTTGAGEDDQPDITADGKHLAYTNTRNHWQLRVRDIASGREQTVFDRTIPMLFPTFSPDGSRIVFFGYAENAVAIFTVGANGGDLRQLTAAPEINHEPSWSADGRSIYFFQTRPTDTFRSIPADGGTSTKFRDWRWETEMGPIFDPTGSLLAYVRQRAPGAPAGGPRDATIIEDAATGNRRELPGEHLHVRRWSADGRSVLGWRHDERAWICTLADGACRVVTRGYLPAWSADERRVFVIRPVTDPIAPQQVWSVNVDGSDERLTADIGRFRRIDRSFDVSRTGQLVWSPFVEGRHEVWTASLVPR